MPWAEVILKPGANVELTPTLNQAGYLRTENGRFKAGMFQKLGGWRKYVEAVFSGTVRSLWPWQDLNRVKRLSVATTVGVTVVTNGSLQDITPQTLLTNPTPDFDTVNGDATVTINDPSTNGLTPGQLVEFLTPIAVGGLILSGTYPIATIVGASVYTIEAQINASSTVSNGGAVPSFTTVADSSIVTVGLTNHAQLVGNTAVFPIATNVGGITIQGKYQVLGVPNANSFTISASAAATSAATVSMNGGNAGFRYYLAIGPVASGIGYGLGDYGEGGYGLGTSSAAQQTGTPLAATDWVQDNWGEILIAVPEGGGIYYWQPGSNFQNLRIIPNAPLFNDGAFVSMAQQQIIAWGSSVDARESGGIGIYQDDLLLKWCDIGDFFVWDQLPENFAREFRISTGSRCISAKASKNRNLVWTDLDLHAMTFNGSDSVYSVNRVGSNCGLTGKHARAQQADTDYWMGVGNFFKYAGDGVTPIECSVWDEVFQRIDPDFRHRVACGSNSDFSEIWWFYPTIGSAGMLTHFAKLSIVEGTWDSGAIDRCAWIDRSVLGNPLGASSTGIVYAHESGYNDDSIALVPIMETGDFYISEGEEFVFVDQVYPDFKYGIEGSAGDAQIQMTMLCRDAPGDDYREYGPFVVSRSTPFINPANPDGTRIRTRQIALRITSIDVDSFWRLGKVRFRYSPDGRR